MQGTIFNHLISFELEKYLQYILSFCLSLFTDVSYIFFVSWTIDFLSNYTEYLKESPKDG